MYLSNPSSNADFTKPAWICQQNHPGRKNRADKCPTTGKSLVSVKELKGGHNCRNMGSKGKRGTNGTGIVIEALFILGVLESY